MGTDSHAQPPEAEDLALVAERARPALVASIRRRLPAGLRGVVDPEDIVQEALTIALQRRDGAISDGGLPTDPQQLVRWLHGTARRRLFHHLEAAVRTASGEGEHWDVCDRSSLLGAERFEHREQLARVLREVRRLPETQRLALWLRQIDGLPWPEVARRLGAPTIAAAQQLQRRARRRLLERLGDAGEDWRVEECPAPDTRFAGEHPAHALDATGDLRGPGAFRGR